MYDRGLSPECHVGGQELGTTTLRDDPDLLSLRNAAMREKEAFLTYRQWARTIADRRLAEVFRQEGLHEAGHFIELNQLLARFDPEQAREFCNRGMGFLAGEPLEVAVEGQKSREGKEKDPEVWLAALREAIDLEYHTLNVYQEDATRAAHPEVAELLARIMNHEKDDLAVFIRELYRLLHR